MRRPGFQPGRDGGLAELIPKLEIAEALVMSWKYDDTSQDEHERLACAQEHLTAALALLRGVESDWRQADRPKRCAVPVQGKNGEAYLCVLHDQHGGECSAYLPEKGGR
jgi:hypothetical protein